MDSFVPAYFSYSSDDLLRRLNECDKNTLLYVYTHDAQSALIADLPRTIHRKPLNVLVREVYAQLQIEMGWLRQSSNSVIQLICHQRRLLDPTLLVDRNVLLGTYMEYRFGKALLRLISKPAYLPPGPSMRSDCDPLFQRTEDDMYSLLMNIDFQELLFIVSRAPSSRNLMGGRSRCTHSALCRILVHYFKTIRQEILRADDSSLRSCIAAVNYKDPIPPESGFSLVITCLHVLFSKPITDCLVPVSAMQDPSPPSEEQVYTWPKKTPLTTILKCMKQYQDNSKWEAPKVCSVCARAVHGSIIESIDVRSPAFQKLNFGILALKDDFIIESASRNSPDRFTHSVAPLNGVMLAKEGIIQHNQDTIVQVCSQCSRSLRKKKMPKFALANGLYRGELPNQFKDLTWIEEMVCCLYRSTAFVTRLYGSTDPKEPRRFYGNTCAHQMNIQSTVDVLPRTPSDILDILTVVWVGTSSYQQACLKKVFQIRKEKVWEFLIWLVRNNKLYYHIRLSRENLELFGADNSIPGVDDRVIQVNLPPDEVFRCETAAMDAHPAEPLYAPTGPGSIPNSDDNEHLDIYLEKTGMSDPNSSTLPGRHLQGSAFANLTVNNASPPDLVIPDIPGAIGEYQNPKLFPGMFPTLFPYGIGGFESSGRSEPVSFNAQANYCFDLHDRSFRYHHSFLFILHNLWQRRQAHLHTHFTVSKPNFERVSDELTEISSETLKRVSAHLKLDSQLCDDDLEGKRVLKLLKYVNTVAANVPGSHASRIKMRNEIRSYIGFMGIAPMFFTANPAPQDSPIFQVMYGDESINLDERYPHLVSGVERSVRLAKDPVAAADFFDFAVECIFRDLFGWDFHLSKSTVDGGILGHLDGFYGSIEYTERGTLHGHFLIWLKGSVNPSEMRRRLSNNPAYQEQVFEYFEDAIRHDLPNVHCPELDDPNYNPRTEMPPPVPDLGSIENEVDLQEAIHNWNGVFVYEVKKCGEKLQRHVCKDTCWKYRKDNLRICRFMFPHEQIEASYYDEETQSIILVVRDGEVNYHNPYVLIVTRHNHDLKWILSGKSAKAAMFYISDYITKMELKTYQVLSLMSNAVVNIENSKERLEGISASKRLLHKCLSQFTRENQIHAQQAARYLRGKGDSICSHKTIPMLSGSTLR